VGVVIVRKIEKRSFKNMMIFATIIFLMMGSITPLITAISPINVCTQLSSHSRTIPNEQLIKVEVSRWTEDNKIVTSFEFWPKDKVDAFQEAMRDADTIDGECFTVMQQYGLIPQCKTQEDLENFFAEQCNQYQQINKKNEHYMNLEASEGFSDVFNDVKIFGKVYAPFFCIHFPFIVCSINSRYGGEIEIDLSDVGTTITRSGTQHFSMFILSWIGLFNPPLHNGKNYIDRVFSGKAGYLSISMA
jgi:hypothetical protein